MKIAITSQGPSLDSLVDPRFGRAKHFILADTEADAFTAHDNAQNLNAPQGAGIQAAQTVARLGAEAVLTGHVGPKAFAVLKAAISPELSPRVDTSTDVIGDPVIDIRNPEKKGELLRAGSVIEGIEYVNLEAILQDVHALLATLQGTVGVIRDISLDSRSNLRTLLANLSGSMATVNDLLVNSQKDILEILTSFRQTAKTMNEISEELKKHPVKFLFKGQK